MVHAVSKPNLGMAIQDIVAGAVHKVILSVLPHWHETKINHHMSLLESTHETAQRVIGPMAQHCLDSGSVHPLLVPLFKLMTGEVD
jgi:hypothetical protein